ncbi:MAG: hypothetical protein JJU36_01290 [Phycisphaeraceae bacterium]|nr:hypothetical protein [Phycisphaeraceae bacterium]
MISESAQWAHPFDQPLDEGIDAAALLGGKGSSLQAMSMAGLPVPPGFTITTDCCARFFELEGRWPDGLQEQVRQQVSDLERKTGRQFGRGTNPLLLSVRSGAAASMPGMMDTLLNCGIHRGLAAPPPEGVGDGPAVWTLLRQFILSYGKVVHGLDEASLFQKAGMEPDADASGRSIDRLHEAFQSLTGERFPDDPWLALRGCIDAVFRSWNNPRARAYRKRHGITQLTGTAVNVQAMFPSRVSGIVFTVDPNFQHPEQMIIEASYGLGEAVVSGEVTPDRFIVHRDELAIIRRFAGQKTTTISALGEPITVDPDRLCLDDEQVIELARLALEVERHFGYPVDMEWGLADGVFSLLQSRRIRGMEVARMVEPARRAEIQRLGEMCNGQRRVWVAHNLGETLRLPTMLSWDIVQRFMRGSGGFGRMYRMLGYRPSQRVMEEGFLEMITGRIYTDPERQAELFWDGMPLSYDPRELINDPSRIGNMPDRFDGNKADIHFLKRLPGNLMGMRRVSREIRRLRPEADKRFNASIVPGFLDMVTKKRRQNLDALDAGALLKELNVRVRLVLTDFGGESLLPGFLGGLAYDRLTGRLTQFFGQEEAARKLAALTRALDGDTTFEQDALLYEVAHGRASLDVFLEKFGHRAIGEMELSVPRWHQDSEPLQPMIQRLTSSSATPPREQHQRMRKLREEAQERLPLDLAEAGASTFEHEVMADLRDVQRLLPFRESGKHYLMMGYSLIRDAIVALGRRLELGDDIFHLTLAELETAVSDASAVAERIQERKILRQAYARLDPPIVIDSAELENLGLAGAVEDADSLDGHPIAAGVASGPARIVMSPDQAGDLGEGYILVCPSTDPGWTPLFIGARGLIVERGGVLSHGAIVARDFGIPAVACPRATQWLKDGDMVRIDGQHGRVVRLAAEGVSRG